MLLQWLGSAALTFLSFIALITVVVFFHELGHLVVGRWRGVKPERFSIGFGPKLFGFMVGETEVRVSALPFGGYVKFAGDNPLEPPKPEDAGRGFYQATPASRALIAVAGPVTNFILAFVIFFALLLAPQTELAPVIGYVKPGSPAAQAGLLPRDRIVSVDGAPTPVFSDVQERISGAYGQPIALGIERDGKPLQLTVTPAMVEEKNAIETQKQGRIGITVSPRLPEVAPLGPLTAAGQAGLQPFDRVEQLGEEKIGSYEELIAALAARVSQSGPAENVELKGTRPRMIAAPGATLWAQDPFSLSMSLPHLGRAVSSSEAEQLLGLASADLNIYAVEPDSAAAQAGLKRGDRMLSVDGKPVIWWSDEVEAERIKRGFAPMQIEVLRGGETMRFEVKQLAKKDWDEAGVKVEVPALGATQDWRILAGEPERVTVRYSALQAAQRAGRETLRATLVIVKGLGGMVSGRISTEAIGGVLMIADVARKAASYGLTAFLGMTAVISVNLGLMNLIPIPVLDGFHVLSAIVERVRHRPLSLRFLELANMFGLALLVSLMLYALKNDLVKKLFD